MVISLTITESSLQKVAGIPDTITVSANVPATIFYTLDGTDPTTSSLIVLAPIQMPGDIGTVTLKLWATDGVNNSAIITNTYGTTTVGNRQPRDTVSGLNQNSIGATYPFGTQNQGGPGVYGNTGGITVDDPLVPGIPDGYDGTGTGHHSNETDLPLTSYSNIFSETDAIGQRGRGIGTLPADVTFVVPNQYLDNPNGSSNTNSPFFNPKALVIFDDSREQPYDPSLPRTNRPHFSLQNPTVSRDGAYLFTSAIDGPAPRGGALKSQFNPRDNTQIFYYFSSDTNRWIISVVPFSPKSPDLYNFSRILFGRDRGVGQVFQWRLFGYRTLF